MTGATGSAGATGATGPSPTTYQTTVPHGGNADLSGTTGNGGGIVGWARLRDSGTSAVLNLTNFLVAFNKATSAAVALAGADAGLAWSHTGTAVNAEQTMMPGYYLELNYTVTPEGS